MNDDNFLRNMVVSILSLGLVAILATIVLSYVDCRALGRNTGIPTMFVFWGGGQDNCLIRVVIPREGYTVETWIPTEKWINNTGN